MYLDRIVHDVISYFHEIKTDFFPFLKKMSQPVLHNGEACHGHHEDIHGHGGQAAQSAHRLMEVQHLLQDMMLSGGPESDTETTSVEIHKREQINAAKVAEAADPPPKDMQEFGERIRDGSAAHLVLKDWQAGQGGKINQALEPYLAVIQLLGWSI